MGFFQEINHPSTGIPCYGNPLAAGRWTAEFPNPPLPSWLTIWCLPDVEWMWATLESFCITYEPIYSPQRSKPAPALNMSIHMDLLIYHIYIYHHTYISYIYHIYIYHIYLYITYIYIYITYIYIYDRDFRAFICSGKLWMFTKLWAPDQKIVCRVQHHVRQDLDKWHVRMFFGKMDAIYSHIQMKKLWYQNIIGCYNLDSSWFI
jgi:hypothetical protein